MIGALRLVVNSKLTSHVSTPHVCSLTLGAHAFAQVTTSHYIRQNSTRTLDPCYKFCLIIKTLTLRQLISIYIFLI